MCARECLAGERCEREAACRAADAKYGPLIRARQIELTRKRLQGLQRACEGCQSCQNRSPERCRACTTPREMAWAHAKLTRLMREGAV